MTIPVDPFAPAGSTARTMPFRVRPLMLPGAALLAILLVGLASSLYTLFFKSGELARDTVSWPGLANGETTSGIAHLLQKENPLGGPLVTTDRVVAWLAAGDLGTQVRRGCDNWLFLTDELVLHADRAENLARHVRFVERVAAFLKQRRVALLVAPVPDKSRVEAAELCGVDRPAAIGGRLSEFQSRLRQAGIDVVDLQRPIAASGGESYYRTDTHWNERAARAAAGAVAAALREQGMAPTQKAEFRVTTEPARERVGDLIRLAGLDHVPWPLRPHGDRAAPTLIEQSAAANVGILDETPAPELAVIGTSFSQTSNFVPFIAMSLGAPVENLAKIGGGITNAAMSYFAKPEFTQSPPRVIVWEIPERMIEEPVEPADETWAGSLGPTRPVN